MTNNRTAIFIDGPNLYATAKALRFEIDFKRLLEHFSDGLIRAYYYTAIIEDASDAHSTIRPLVDWLSYNGYTMVTKPAKQWVQTDGKTKTKGNMDIELAVDALDISPHIDHAVFFTGDGDFTALVLALHRRGLKVTIVSSILTQPPMCADELRRAGTFIELAELAKYIVRQEGERPRSQYSRG